MAHTVWVLLMVVLALIAALAIICFVGGACLAVLSTIASSLIFWGALVGGLVSFMFTHGSVDALIIGAVIGGVVGGLIHHGPTSLIKIIIWTLVGVGVGSMFGMMIVFGIIGFVIGLVRAF